MGVHAPTSKGHLGPSQQQADLGNVIDRAAVLHSCEDLRAVLTQLQKQLKSENERHASLSLSLTNAWAAHEDLLQKLQVTDGTSSSSNVGSPSLAQPPSHSTMTPHSSGAGWSQYPCGPAASTPPMPSVHNKAVTSTLDGSGSHEGDQIPHIKGRVSKKHTCGTPCSDGTPTPQELEHVPLKSTDVHRQDGVEKEEDQILRLEQQTTMVAAPAHQDHAEEEQAVPQVMVHQPEPPQISKRMQQGFETAMRNGPPVLGGPSCYW